ncbi:branched-chain amino acid ABC transporter permease [Quisquiliibacterium transsilvanicum]|jgi:branched-chain amino acid transport system permease protein|uniref:Branched-chain amino acid transport system permease protein n=1 Tax=Quisquiliibacterium transsilvanicum TaxID=1549638 RepID=A0A7W8HGL4_9BURK|nr:branched-chain amino acid ABC transporter permease [Quisquiliibacterium transsilvanicum]MBB5271651.1 branched-chain amino acid transport system permease protein [Quisquiliibacterium transsilvanicum]
MPLETILNVVTGGLLTGLVYGLMALGLSVIYGVVRIVNFAHGEMMALAMYVAVVAFAAFGADPLWMLAPVALVFFAFGYLLQRGLVNRFIDRPEHSQFMLLLAVALIMVNGLLIAFGPDARNVQVDYALDSYEIGPLLVDKVRVICAVVALLCCAGLFAIFRFTGFGKAIRACADNLLGAQVVGLNVKHLYGLTFGLGAACVGIAGCLLSLLVDVTPASGPAFTLLAFVIVIIGGLGSMVGALAGGVLIGVSESIAGLLIAPSMKSMVSFALLILVLAFRPQGLFSRR